MEYRCVYRVAIMSKSATLSDDIYIIYTIFTSRLQQQITEFALLQKTVAFRANKKNCLLFICYSETVYRSNSK